MKKIDYLSKIAEFCFKNENFIITRCYSSPNETEMWIDGYMENEGFKFESYRKASSFEDIYDQLIKEFQEWQNEKKD